MHGRQVQRCWRYHLLVYVDHTNPKMCGVRSQLLTYPHYLHGVGFCAFSQLARPTRTRRRRVSRRAPTAAPARRPAARPDRRRHLRAPVRDPNPAPANSRPPASLIAVHPSGRSIDPKRQRALSTPSRPALASAAPPARPAPTPKASLAHRRAHVWASPKSQSPAGATWLTPFRCPSRPSLPALPAHRVHCRKVCG